MMRFQIACAGALMLADITGTFLALGALRLRRDGRRSPWSTLSSVGIGAGPRLPKKHRLLAREVLPSLDGNLDVLWVDLDGVAAATDLFGRDECCAGARERLVHIAAVAPNGSAHGLDGLLRRVVVLLLGRAAHDHLGAGHLPQRGVGMTPPPRCGLAFPDRVPTGLVLPVVGGAAHRRLRFGPDDLLAQLEADPLETLADLDHARRGTPDVSHFQTRHQFERLRPVCPRVAR